jgi:hypothetical protein
VDLTGVYLNFDYFSPMDIDPGEQEYILPYVRSIDAGIAKFDQDGNFLWVLAFGSNSNDFTSLSFTDDDQLLVNALDTLRIYDKNGNFVAFTENSLPLVPSGLDDDGLALRIGSYINEVDFDPTEGEFIRVSSLDLTGNPNFDIYVVKYQQDFRPLWLLTINGQEQLLLRDFSLSTENTVYLISERAGTITLDDGKTVNSYMGTGKNNLMILKVKTCIPVFVTLDRESCDSYSFAGKVLDNSGIYLDTLQSRSGCDSIVSLNLTITRSDSISIDTFSCIPFLFADKMIDSSGTYTFSLTNSKECDSTVTLNVDLPVLRPEVILVDTQLIAVSTDVNYQWLNCDHEFSAVEQATQQVFIPNINGNYAVEISALGCTSRSECISFATTAVFEPHFLTLAVWPNPASELLYFDDERIGPESELLVYNLEARLIWSGKAPSVLDIGKFTTGTYILLLRNEKEVFRALFTKI